jgi:hypothetical protein
MNDGLWAGSQPGDYTGLVRRAGPCRLGGNHTKPAPNGMVYCEHGLSVFACHDGCTDLPPIDPICEVCGGLKETHSETEAAYCITRGLALVSERSIYVAGVKRQEPRK